jgi:pyrimidine deaminase RibD-like protein
MKAILRKLIEKSTHRLFFHAVLVERGGAILSSGYNHGKIHAEVNALSKLWPNKRAGTKVWSIRITKSDTLGMAKPCSACEAFLRENGVKTVMYSTPHGFERLKL